MPAPGLSCHLYALALPSSFLFCSCILLFTFPHGRHPAACSGWVLGARVSPACQGLLGQAAASGAPVRTVQPCQPSAACSGPRLHRLRHQVLWAAEPGCVLGRLPERSTAGGAQGGLHYRLAEESGWAGGRAAAGQRRPGRLWRGQEGTAQQPGTQHSKWSSAQVRKWPHNFKIDFDPGLEWDLDLGHETHHHQEFLYRQ